MGKWENIRKTIFSTWTIAAKETKSTWYNYWKKLQQTLNKIPPNNLLPSTPRKNPNHPHKPYQVLNLAAASAEQWLCWIVWKQGIGTIELEKLACGIQPISLPMLESLSGHLVGPCLKQPFAVNLEKLFEGITMGSWVKTINPYEARL